MDFESYWSKEYAEGFSAWEDYFNSNFEKKCENPYAKNTEEFKNWNRGWNRNIQGI